jgi:Spy/CpxP family protein refolding chaperone
MTRTLKTLAVAGLLAATASLASAAPVSVGQVPAGVANGLVQIHGDHRSCERDRRGWHRHNRNGERRECREWRGEGRRPDSCVRVGPVWYCEY